MATLPESHRRTLALSCGGAVRVHWDLPPAPARGWVWVQHGFARRGHHLAGIAGALTSNGWAAVRPDLVSLSPRHSIHDRSYLLRCARAITASADDVLGVTMEGVGVGHSAGGAVLGWLSSRGVGLGPLILLDPVDTVGGLLHDARLTTPLVLAVMQPSRCNRGGATTTRLAAAGWPTTTFSELSHADPERIPSTLHPRDVSVSSWAVRRACGQGGRADEVVGLGGWIVAATAQTRE